MTPDDLLGQLGELATSLGPAVRPAGTDELLRSLTETARRLFGAAACSLALLTEDESELVYTVAAGQGADDVTGMRIPASRGIAGWVVQSGQPIAVSDVASDPRFAREQAEQTGYIPQAILAVPVETPARLLGVISLLDRDPRRPGAEQDMALLSLFADQAALALASVDQFSRMGRVLLDALARAAASDAPARAAASDAPARAAASDAVAAALRHAADHPPTADADLAELAAAFAALARRGAAERRLALAVLRDIADYVERRPSRPR
jgi:GAF domain-containing protein